MVLIPSFDAFQTEFEEGNNQVVYTRLAADLDTPVSVMLKLARARTDSFMLESVTGGEVRGRYSVVGLKPDLIWRCRGTGSEINRSARFDADAFEPMPGDPLSARSDFDWSRAMARSGANGDWAVRVDTTLSQWADERNFFVEATLTAYEGAEKVFEKSFSEKVPRA